MDYLSARLPVLDLALHAVGAFQGGGELDPARVAASFMGDRMLRIDGEPVSGFAELSGFFEAADGWVRTHANYPHHRRRLLAVLGLDDGDRATVADRIRRLDAADLEDRAAEAGAIAVRVRTESEWAASKPGIAAAAGPLVAVEERADTGPANGFRVLDFTRVIAGPTATRALALVGAEVLRIDPPHLPEIEWQHLENGQGKRSALLDLRTDLARARELAARADVIVSGYRPGALEALGIAPAPGAIHARVSAWGTTGPWGERRGFDSIVQAASGISLIEGGGAGSEQVAALPAQALDHATGYLLAAAILDARTARDRDGHGRDVAASLARTAAWLLAAPGRRSTAPPPTTPGPVTTVTHNGIRTARPALARYDDYPFPARPYGRDEPAWLT